jgi:hypothetical protein
MIYDSRAQHTYIPLDLLFHLSFVSIKNRLNYKFDINSRGAKKYFRLPVEWEAANSVSVNGGSRCEAKNKRQRRQIYRITRLIIYYMTHLCDINYDILSLAK